VPKARARCNRRPRARSIRRADCRHESARIERRLDALLETAGPCFAAFAARFDFARYRSLADIGGMTGLLSCLVAERHAQVACRSYDLAIVRPIAERRIRERGLGGRVRAETLDFVADEFPAADIITMGVILHDWNVQRQKMLIAKAHRALSSGGAMVALACLDAAAPAKAAAPAPGGALEFGDSWDLTGIMFQRWCAQAGFARCEVLTLGAAAGATIAYK
jgi:hypothetical protein